MTTNTFKNMKSGLIIPILRLYLCIAVVALVVSAMNLFDIKLVESNDSRLVATSNYNYAISSPKLLARNWQTVSVNGDLISIVTTQGEKILKTRAQLGEVDRAFLESLRDEIAESNFGYTHTSMSGGLGGGSSMMSSTSQGGSFSTSGGFSSSNFETSGSGNGMSVNLKDDNNFSVAKSNLPFNWLRVLLNGNIVTVVSKDGQVQMRPLNSLDADQLAAINNLRVEIRDFQRTSSQQVANTMQHSMDMVNNIFGNIMGSLPKPPSYSSAVGNMFGDNFPFGSGNSPFNAASGWPFGGGVGSFAFAGRR